MFVICFISQYFYNKSDIFYDFLANFFIETLCFNYNVNYEYCLKL